MKFVLLFIDGLGVGKNDPESNPCTRDETGLLKVFKNEESSNSPFDGVSKGLDATLGVSGLPQSATGQTALLTGINASELLGYHLSGFPNKVLREILLKHSILLQAVQLQKKATFKRLNLGYFF